MKKTLHLLFGLLFFAITALGQSITITPNQSVQKNNSSIRNIEVRTTNNSGGVFGFRHNGTLELPTPVTTGQHLFRYSGGGYYSGASVYGAGSIKFFATENWNADANGGKASIWTTPNGTYDETERLTVDHNGFVGIGASTPSAKFQIYDVTTNAIQAMQITTGATGNTATDGLGISIFSSSDFTAPRAARIMNNEDAQLILGANNLNTLRITPTGNIGVNTAFAPTARFHIYHDTENDPTKPHLNLVNNENTNNGMVRMTNFLQTRYFGQYFNVSSTTAANNYVSFDYNGSTPILDMHGNGNIDHAGFTKLGADAPKIKMKKLSGTTSASQGGTSAAIIHGIADPTKILAINVMVQYNPGSPNDAWVGNGYTGSAGYEFSYQYDGGNIYIVNTPANSAAILSKAIKILLTYEE